MIPPIYELTNFTILLLGMSVNQAGLEQSFSDLKIKKTHLWNCLGLPKLEKMAKVMITTLITHLWLILAHCASLQVGADIQQSQKEAGLIEEWTKCKNHDPTGISQLLAVPWYADLLEDGTDVSENEEEPVLKPWSGLVKLGAGWCKEMAKWVQDEQARSDDSDSNDLGDAATRRQCSKWLPRSLALLFGGEKERSTDEQARWARQHQAYTKEVRLMELLVNEELDEERIPDDGELEGLGDNFDGWWNSAIFSQCLNNPLESSLNLRFYLRLKA